MFKILADTCVWENLAKDPQQRPLLNVIFELETSGDLGLIVPRIVLEEFGRRRAKGPAHGSHFRFRQTLRFSTPTASAY